ncbi:MAG: type I restriction enzyme HsdR N-terminal domain-containing protein [Clostridium sp.]|uniref:type I restriction enzyme HsdR N-terminal domain-containing protein n=1 Tax=Clostridium sp. TaxID=1506 RepID=UPI0029106E85|nr:type I restriction enzyme HsdR N-terminal domain-containing protein [Clostridium sp.]MDU4939771.1 type I restriction enzyme HsdR N-terminal domain-containing protein [Clostridium sp.]
MIAEMKTNYKKEENIKIKVVIPILEKLGYKISNMTFEHEVFKGKKYCDIAINIRADEYLYIEVKRGDYSIANKDIMQLSNYLNTAGIEWGIITNGSKYILINNNIKLPSSDKKVLEVDINRDSNNLKYFSKEYLFGNRKTYYYTYVAYFKGIRGYKDEDQTWIVYRGTIYKFIKYLEDKYNDFEELEKINKRDIIEFLEKECRNSRRDIDSDETIKNKISHINTMYEVLYENKVIRNISFDKKRDDILNKFKLESKKYDLVLEKRDIETIFFHLEKGRNSLRNKTIITLATFLGLNKSQILKVRKESFDFINNTIVLNGRIVPLPEKIINMVKELINKNEAEGIKGNGVFYCRYNGKYKLINKEVLGEVLKDVQKIDEEKFRKFTYNRSRIMAVRILFDNGFSIDDIVRITGIKLTGIAKIIDNNEIYNKTDKGLRKRIENNHPFI